MATDTTPAVHRRMLLVVVTVIAMLLAFAGPSGAKQDDEPTSGLGNPEVLEGEYDSYIVVMKADPLVVTEGQDNLDSSAAKKRGNSLKAAQRKAAREAGVSESEIVSQYVNALNGFSALIDHDTAQRVATDKTVAYVMPDELHQPTTDASGDFLGLTAPAGPYATGTTGEGVVVGVIDSGIWPEHPSFADDGSLSPPPVPAIPCEFGNTAHNPDDAPFECNNKLIGARQTIPTYRALIGAEPFEFDSARDDDGHGTHTASTAAGNADVPVEMFGQEYPAVTGIAYDAHVVAYKGLGTLGGFTSDLALSIDTAVADGVDVINYSIGGGATVTLGADDLAFLFAADAGVFVATSAGNSGPGDQTVGSPAHVPWLTSVGANTQTRFFAGTLELGNGESYEGASVTPALDGEYPLVDAEDAGDDLCNPGALDPEVVEGAIVLCRRGAIARVAKSEAVQIAGGVGMVMYENTDDNNLYTDPHFVPSVHVDNTPGLAIKAYIDAAGADATASIVDTGAVSEWPSAPSMTQFSSRGPNIYGDIIKPDITAPGMQILAGNTPMPAPGSVPGELFQAIAGTSMSSPHIAGLFALMKEAHPDWSPAAAKSALMTSADTDVVDNDRVSQANPFEMGAGMADAGRTNAKGSAFQPGLVYDAGFNDYLGFMCDADPSVFGDAAATCAFLADIGIGTDSSQLNYPSIGVDGLPGSETITRTVTSVAQENGNRTYTVDIEAPDGYDVEVSPSTLKLRKGQSASFEVTITNVSAPLGEWRFGSLTWSDKTGNYAVRSPIAVNASSFDVAESVTGSGESGSVSIPISFGYTGAYTAAAHGLEPATVIEDNVVQDPDQAFSPDDGFSNAHVFDVAGAAYLRFAMPPDAVADPAIDLDLFLFDPDGNQVAESTSGGTSELIDLTLPADGTYTLYVHGWQTAGPSADYTLYSWEVSATPGGNLSIDSAPSEAIIGTSDTIEASWSGATAGQWHLGAVSHADGDGLLGLTLVDVDNR